METGHNNEILLQKLNQTVLSINTQKINNGKKVEILGPAGKKVGIHQNWLNVRSDELTSSIEWSTVDEWKLADNILTHLMTRFVSV